MCRATVIRTHHTDKPTSCQLLYCSTKLHYNRLDHPKKPSYRRIHWWTGVRVRSAITKNNSDADEFSILVASGASGHILYGELLPELDKILETSHCFTLL